VEKVPLFDNNHIIVIHFSLNDCGPERNIRPKYDTINHGYITSISRYISIRYPFFLAPLSSHAKLIQLMVVRAPGQQPGSSHQRA